MSTSNKYFNISSWYLLTIIVLFFFIWIFSHYNLNLYLFIALILFVFFGVIFISWVVLVRLYNKYGNNLLINLFIFHNTLSDNFVIPRDLKLISKISFIDYILLISKLTSGVFYLKSSKKRFLLLANKYFGNQIKIK